MNLAELILEAVFEACHLWQVKILVLSKYTVRSETKIEDINK